MPPSTYDLYVLPTPYYTATFFSNFTKFSRSAFCRRGDSRLQDSGTDEFTSVSKWNDIVVNLGATKSSGSSLVPFYPPADKDKTKQTACMMPERERERESDKVRRGRTDSWRNNKGKQQQIACPSALGCNTQHNIQRTHIYFVRREERILFHRLCRPATPPAQLQH